MTEKFTPKRGEIVVVPELPLCDFCKMNGKDVEALYDFATYMGPWGNGCERHWQELRVGLLGMGVGQRLITPDQVERTPIQQAKYDAQQQRAEMVRLYDAQIGKIRQL